METTYLNVCDRPISRWSIVRLLKTVLLLLCVSFSSVYVQASDRSEGITISCKNESLEQVIHLIESQSSYLFVLNDKVNTKHKVSIKIENGNINAILNKIFQGTNMTYQVDGDHILISTTHKSIGLDETRQTTMIKGKIVDNAGEPMIGVNVLVKGTTNGAITDFESSSTIRSFSIGIILPFFKPACGSDNFRAGSIQNIEIRRDQDHGNILVYNILQKTDQFRRIGGIVKSLRIFNQKNPASGTDMASDQYFKLHIRIPVYRRIPCGTIVFPQNIVTVQLGHNVPEHI